MSGDSDDATIPPYEHRPFAPFVFFDMAPTLGVVGGVVHVELAARVLIPGAHGPKAQFVAAAHLRCGAPAARELISALQSALDMLETPQGADITAKFN